MQKITNVNELKNAIQLLEVEQTFKMQLMKEQFFAIRDSFKPINLLKSTFKDIITSPNLVENILSTVLGLASGYFSKKLVVGASSNVIRKVIGTILQIGVTKVIAKHPDAIKSFGQNIFHNIFRKKQ